MQMKKHLHLLDNACAAFRKHSPNALHKRNTANTKRYKKLKHVLSSWGRCVFIFASFFKLGAAFLLMEMFWTDTNMYTLAKHLNICCTSMRVAACWFAYIPACNQIWARVIQGCMGPCLGALLCREEATSDRACSTRLAAIDVAWTEPGGRKSKHYTPSSPAGTD